MDQDTRKNDAEHYNMPDYRGTEHQRILELSSNILHEADGPLDDDLL